jgi:FixJ family two-component response regulator
MSDIKPTVHIVDDDPSFLAAISRLLRVSGFTVETFSTASDFLTQRDSEGSGCVLADLEMPRMSGFDLQLALAQTNNPLPIVFLTGHGDIPSTVRAMQRGAEDFLEKRAPKEKVLDAVKRSLARDTFERESRARLHDLRARFNALSKRELEVLSHVVQGKLNKQIAGDLCIHERTVKLHRTSITTKIRVQSVAELTKMTLQAGIFTSPDPTFP